MTPLTPSIALFKTSGSVRSGIIIDSKLSGANLDRKSSSSHGFPDRTVPRTRYPRHRSCRTTCEPIYPLAPVTKMRDPGAISYSSFLMDDIVVGRYTPVANLLGYKFWIEVALLSVSCRIPRDYGDIYILFHHAMEQMYASVELGKVSQLILCGGYSSPICHLQSKIQL